MNNEIPVEHSGWEVMKEKLHPKNIWQSIVESKDKLMMIAICFVLGFVSGYLFKKYVQLLVTLIIFIMFCFLLRYFDWITFSVNEVKVRSLLGLEPTVQLDGSLINLYIEWGKQNLHIVLSYAIGFLVGMRSA